MYAPSIQTYPFAPIALSARDEINARIAPWEFRNSEYNFSNLFIWQPVCQTQYAFIDDTLLIRFQCRRDDEFLMPPLPASPQSDYKRALEIAIDYFDQTGQRFSMRGITPPMKERMEAAMPGRFTYEHERDSDDYVYSAESLATLAGKKLHAKRNHINKFNSLYTYTYEDYDPALHAEECIALNLAWHEYKDDEDQRLMSREQDAVTRCLLYAKQLGLTGAVIRIDGDVQAFSLGEALTDDTALIHMEKANAEIPGLYPLINQQFVQHAWADKTYINREEDMGIEGLRKAKMSYYPEFLIEKYRARLA